MSDQVHNFVTSWSDHRSVNIQFTKFESLHIVLFICADSRHYFIEIGTTSEKTILEEKSGKVTLSTRVTVYQ